VDDAINAIFGDMAKFIVTGHPEGFVIFLLVFGALAALAWGASWFLTRARSS
jgi:hypothetical protein